MSQSYTDAVFRATHNSYSGAERHSVREQLDRGVRVLEIDIISPEFERYGYRVGHGWPGAGIAMGDGNPDNDRLASWLGEIAKWCDAHESKGPVTVILDPKSDLSDNPSFARGNLASLNDDVTKAFGSRLFRADAIGGEEWPPLAELRGQIIAVLSGNLDSRRGYCEDGGCEPAVAMDGSGRVVEVHYSRRGHLWYWSGRREGVHVRWLRHGRIGPGRSPAVALGPGGSLVVVYSGASGIAYRLGRLDGDTLEIAWGEARDSSYVAAGTPRPTVRVGDDGRVRITYATDYGRQARTGQLQDDWVAWDSAAERPTVDDLREQAHMARVGDTEVIVSAVPASRCDGEVLVYGTEAAESAAVPIAYEQVLFVEGQWVADEGDHDITGSRRFVATKARPEAIEMLDRWRAQGKVVRLWDFREDHATPRFRPNFPATDYPFRAWYERYCVERGAVD